VRRLVNLHLLLFVQELVAAEMIIASIKKFYLSYIIYPYTSSFASEIA